MFFAVMGQSRVHRCKRVNPVAPEKEFLTADYTDDPDEECKFVSFASFLPNPCHPRHPRLNFSFFYQLHEIPP